MSTPTLEEILNKITEKRNKKFLEDIMKFAGRPLNEDVNKIAMSKTPFDNKSFLSDLSDLLQKHGIDKYFNMPSFSLAAVIMNFINSLAEVYVIFKLFGTNDGNTYVPPKENENPNWLYSGTNSEGTNSAVVESPVEFPVEVLESPVESEIRRRFYDNGIDTKSEPAIFRSGRSTNKDFDDYSTNTDNKRNRLFDGKV